MKFVLLHIALVWNVQDPKCVSTQGTVGQIPKMIIVEFNNSYMMIIVNIVYNNYSTRNDNVRYLVISEICVNVKIINDIIYHNSNTTKVTYIGSKYWRKYCEKMFIFVTHRNVFYPVHGNSIKSVIMRGVIFVE